MNKYAHRYTPTPMSQVRPGRAEFCVKACVWWSRSPRSWVWAPASRSPRDNEPARSGMHPRNPSEMTGTFQKCHRCFDFPPLGSRAGHAERADKKSAFLMIIYIGEKNNQKYTIIDTIYLHPVMLSEMYLGLRIILCLYCLSIFFVENTLFYYSIIFKLFII